MFKIKTSRNIQRLRKFSIEVINLELEKNALTDSILATQTKLALKKEPKAREPTKKFNITSTH